ncbi:MAG: ribosome maturation protein RimP [Sphingopyxis sp.]
MADIATIADLVEPEAKALGFDLVRVRFFGDSASDDGPTLQVMAERPDTGQLTIDDCSALSHRLSDLFDIMEAEGRDPFDAAYRLEVSSPGIDRPLTRTKDFADWAGHEAKVTLAEGAPPIDGGALRKNLNGIIGSVDDGIIHLADRKAGPLSFPFSDVAEAKLLLTDRLIAATRPLDTSGAEEVDDGADDIETYQAED